LPAGKKARALPVACPEWSLVWIPGLTLLTLSTGDHHMAEADLELDDDDITALAKLDSKMECIRVAVKSLSGRYQSGFFLWGEGGCGKSYTIFEELRRQRAKYVLHNSRLTARGLADALERAPDDIHVIEDCETMFGDAKTAGVLRSALFSQSKAKPSRRIVTWGAFGTSIRFVFTGSIIIVSNANLAQQRPELRALASRIGVFRLDVENAELLALMKKICGDGFRYGRDYLTPIECWEVGTYIRENLAKLQRPLDLRLLTHGFKDFLQWKNDESGSLHWHDLMLSRLQEAIRPAAFLRADRIAQEKKFAAELSHLKIPLKEKIARFMAIGDYKNAESAERAYYRRLQGK
jgi:hypothetical protein